MIPKQAKRSRGRSELQQIVANLLQGVLLADTRGAIHWANAAALEMHGCARLAALGANATGYRKRFALHYLNNRALTARQYPLARLVAGGHFDGVTVALAHCPEDGFRRVLELRGFPVRDESGAVSALALILKDVTERQSADERFERTFAANPAPAVILRLEDSRYIKVNQGFLEMTGFAQDQVIDRPFRELDVLREAEHREAAIAAMREHRTVPQQEALLQVQGGVEKFVIVAGQPIDVEERPCMLFTFNDLEARKRAEMSLRQSEERFATAFRLAPVPMLICARSGWRVLAANEAFGAVTGYRHADIQAQSLREIGFWKHTKVLEDLGSSLDAGEEVRGREVPLLTRGGAGIDGLLSAEPVSIQEESCVLCVVQDITERKRSEADVVRAIEAVMKDASWFSRTIMEKLAQIRHPAGVEGELASLTPRELEILGLVCKGQGDAEIAASLKLSRNTVRNHIANLYGKIGVKRRSAAVIWGRERGVPSY